MPPRSRSRRLPQVLVWTCRTWSLYQSQHGRRSQGEERQERRVFLTAHAPTDSLLTTSVYVSCLFSSMAASAPDSSSFAQRPIGPCSLTFPKHLEPTRTSPSRLTTRQLPSISLLLRQINGDAPLTSIASS